jgi:hypothetical protein
MTARTRGHEWTRLRLRGSRRLREEFVLEDFRAWVDSSADLSDDETENEARQKKLVGDDAVYEPTVNDMYDRDAKVHRKLETERSGVKYANVSTNAIFDKEGEPRFVDQQEDPGDGNAVALARGNLIMLDYYYRVYSYHPEMKAISYIGEETRMTEGLGTLMAGAVVVGAIVALWLRRSCLSGNKVRRAVSLELKAYGYRQL